MKLTKKFIEKMCGVILLRPCYLCEHVQTVYVYWKQFWLNLVKSKLTIVHVLAETEGVKIIL